MMADSISTLMFFPDLANLIAGSVIEQNRKRVVAMPEDCYTTGTQMKPQVMNNLGLGYSVNFEIYGE